MERKFIVNFLKQLSDIMSENRSYLIELDSIVGDGDLGLTMSDGFHAAYNAVKDSEESDLGKLLYTAGKTMAQAVPSTMGTLMASGFMQAGKKFKGEQETDDLGMVTLLDSFAEGVMTRGKAKPGEKTFLDGLVPAIEAMQQAFGSGMDKGQAASEAVAGAKSGFENTTTMIAVHGRAATRGEASREMYDPGAAVAVLIITALEKAVAADNGI